MNKYGFVWAISLLLLALNFLLMYKLKEQKAQYAFKEKENETTIFRYQVKMDLFSQNTIYQQKNEGNKINNLVLKNKDNVPFSLAELSKKGSILFFRFKEEHCGECIRSILEILSKNAQKFSLNIIILSGYNTMRLLKVFILENKLNIPIYNVPEISDLSIETLDVPYFFILNAKMEIRNIFIPIKSMPELTESYLMTMQNKYQDVAKN